MKKISYEGITFNATWAASKSEKDFIEHERHSGLTDAKLKEAHKLCKEAVKAPVLPNTPDA